MDDLDTLIERAKGVTMTPEEREKQRQSFAYGNSNIENERITRDSIREESKKLAAANGKKD